MKILAIRGENIASLYGKFEVDLTKPPLAGAGLFAIVGPTGAGKSTLFDTMCLALYGDAPRIEGRGGARIGREDEPEEALFVATDPKSLVSRGCSEAFAKVEFIGRDGKHYEAKWWVAKKVRGNDRRLREPQMKVMDLGSGEDKASGVTQSIAFVTKAIGFTYEEFRRAVVLPQGDFAAFLHAEQKERATLLEKITGTAIYSTIGRLASERAREAKDAFEAAKIGLEALTVLGDDERQLEEAKCKQLKEELELVQAGIAELEKARDWYLVLHKLGEQKASAEIEKKAALDESEAANTKRTVLQDVKRAHGLRAEYEAAKRLEQTQAELRTKIASITAALEEAKIRRDAAKSALEKAESELANATQLREATRPELNEARRLDARLESERDALVGVASREEDARKKDASAKRECDEERAHLEKTTADMIAAGAWLEEHRNQQSLVEQWPRWDGGLKNYSAEMLALAGVREDLTQLAKKQKAASEAAAELVKTLEGIEGQGKAEREKHEEAERKLAKLDRDSIEQRVEAHSLRAKALEKLREIEDEWRSRAEELHEQERLAESAGKKADEFKRQREEIEKLKKQALEELEKARSEREKAKATVDLADYRSQLQEKEPCPLCGSVDHPYASKAPASGALKKADALLKKCELRCKELEERDHEVGREEAEKRAESRTALSHVAQCRKDLDKRLAQWSAAAKHAEIAELSETPDGAQELLTAQSAKVSKELNKANADKKEQQSLADASKKALKAVEEHSRRAKQIAEQLQSSRNQIHEAESAFKAVEAQAQQKQDRCKGIAESIGPALEWLPDWQRRLEEDAVALRDQCKEVIAAYEEKRETHKWAGEGTVACEKNLKAFEAHAAERKIALDKARKERKECEERRRELEGQRKALLNGKPTNEVEEQHERRCKSLGAQADSAREALVRAASELQKRTTELEGANAAKSQAEKEGELAREKLNARLTAVGLDRAALEGFLEHKEDWIRETEQALEALRKKVTEAETRLAERQRNLHEHEAEDRPAIEEAQLAERIGDAAQKRTAANEAYENSRGKLVNDDDIRKRRAALEPEQSEKEKTKLRWEKIAQLIGGDRFRDYAQGLALEALLFEANRHLADVAPRYRLMRVPRSNLDLQVEDLDLGGEVRGVNSLSGGETFLVSLGLALGLSSIAGRATSIETLFIDEGFGSLDAETLDHAMSVLESLRATGRTIGIISHVEELHERIGVLVKVERTGVGRSRVTTWSSADLAAG